jgi:hypothetical protein
MTDFDLTIALSGLNLALTLAVIIGARGDRRRLGELESALRRHDERLACVETAAERVPTHDDLAKIYERVNDTSRLIHRVEGTVSKMDDNLRMVLDRMMRDLNTRT